MFKKIFETAEAADNNSLDNIPTYSISWADAEDPEVVNSVEIIEQIQERELEIPTQQQEEEEEVEEKVSTNVFKDDLEIDEYMNKAISQLSLDQRLSPNVQMTKSPSKEEIQPSPIPIPDADQDRLSTPKLNDMSTSPIPIKSPSLIDAPIEKEESIKELVVDTEVVDDNRGNF